MKQDVIVQMELPNYRQWEANACTRFNAHYLLELYKGSYIDAKLGKNKVDSNWAVEGMNLGFMSIGQLAAGTYTVKLHQAREKSLPHEFAMETFCK